MDNNNTSSTTLEANRVLRILLAIVGTLLCLVPFRLLLKNKQYAALILIVAVATMNFFTVINSTIWPNDNYVLWWDGRGLCDLQIYLLAPLQTMYAASIFAIIRRLSSQVRLVQVTGLDNGGQRKRLMVEAVIIFGAPFIQLLFTWFDLAQRYIVGALIGCSAVYDNSWPKALVFDAPPAVFAVGAVPYAYLTWTRYHTVSRSDESAFEDGTNLEACRRVARTRRRLYRMCLSILVLYVPLMLFFLVINLKATFSGSKSYSYHRIHHESSPYPWHAILFVPSWLVPPATLNQPWIPIGTTAVIVAFFGATNDAVKMWKDIGETAGSTVFIECARRRTRRLMLWRSQYGRKSEQDTDNWKRAFSKREDRLDVTDSKRPVTPNFFLPPSDTRVTAATDQTHTSKYSFDANLLLPNPSAHRPRTPPSPPSSHKSYWIISSGKHKPFLRSSLPRPPPQSHKSSASESTIKEAHILGNHPYRLPPLPSLDSSSALEDSQIIAAVIPPRSSSLRHKGAAFLQSLRTPTFPRMPTITIPSLPSLPSSVSEKLNNRLGSWGSKMTRRGPGDVEAQSSSQERMCQAAEGFDDYGDGESGRRDIPNQKAPECHGRSKSHTIQGSSPLAASQRHDQSYNLPACKTRSRGETAFHERSCHHLQQSKKKQHGSILGQTLLRPSGPSLSDSSPMASKKSPMEMKSHPVHSLPPPHKHGISYSSLLRPTAKRTADVTSSTTKPIPKIAGAKSSKSPRKTGARTNPNRSNKTVTTIPQQQGDQEASRHTHLRVPSTGFLEHRRQRNQEKHAAPAPAPAAPARRTRDTKVQALTPLNRAKAYNNESAVILPIHQHRSTTQPHHGDNSQTTTQNQDLDTRSTSDDYNDDHDREYHDDYQAHDLPDDDDDDVDEYEDEDTITTGGHHTGLHLSSSRSRRGRGEATAVPLVFTNASLVTTGSARGVVVVSRSGDGSGSGGIDSENRDRRIISHHGDMYGA